jgi:polysaccharide export outer membrane protein
MRLSILAALVGLIVLSGCNGRSDYSLLKTEQKVEQNHIELEQTIDYRILPHDRLQVSIYSNPELANFGNENNILSTEIQKNGMLVNAEGYIFLPLLNRVKVAGLTQSEAAARITERYKTYLKIPLVYIEVVNKRVYMLGEVNKPGPIELDREKVTLLEAIALAGDLTDSAIRDNVIIVSHNALNNKMYIRSVDLVHFDQLSISNMMLKPNDIVYVQPDGWKEFKVVSDNITTPLVTISQIAAGYASFKYIRDN